MTTTRVYATWLLIMGESSLRAGLDTYAGRHLTTAQIDTLERSYRAAIHQALGDTRIILAGDEFIGPADATFDDVTRSVLAELIKSVSVDDLHRAQMTDG